MTDAGLLTKNFEVINYESVHKITMKPDTAILDEAHHALSGYPKPGKVMLKVASIVWGLPIVYMSATPHSESFSQLYHQLRMSMWSPFAAYENFFIWHREFGIPDVVYLGRRSVPSYKKTQEERLKLIFDPYCYGITRSEVGFKHEPIDEIHHVELLDYTTQHLNNLQQHSATVMGDYDIICESIGAELQKRYQLEGGTMKIQVGVQQMKGLDSEGKKRYKPVYQNIFTGNTEKIDHIKQTWGDTADMVIMYNYKNEELLLKQHFKYALIRQADKFAEGVSFKDYKHLIIYSMSWRTSKYIQRRSRQADLERDEPIVVHYLLVKDAMSEDIYDCVANKRVNFNKRVYESYYKGL